MPSPEVLAPQQHSTVATPASHLAAHRQHVYLLADRHSGWWRLRCAWTLRGPAAAPHLHAPRRSRRPKLVEAPELATHQVDAVVLVGGKGTSTAAADAVGAWANAPTAGLPFLTHSALPRDRRIEHVDPGYVLNPARSGVRRRSALGLQIEYVTEEQSLGTGGGTPTLPVKRRNDTAMVF